HALAAPGRAAAVARCGGATRYSQSLCRLGDGAVTRTGEAQHDRLSSRSGRISPRDPRAPHRADGYGLLRTSRYSDGSGWRAAIRRRVSHETLVRLAHVRRVRAYLDRLTLADARVADACDRADQASVF